MEHPSLFIKLVQRFRYPEGAGHLSIANESS